MRYLFTYGNFNSKIQQAILEDEILNNMIDEITLKDFIDHLLVGTVVTGIKSEKDALDLFLLLSKKIDIASVVSRELINTLCDKEYVNVLKYLLQNIEEKQKEYYLKFIVLRYKSLNLCKMSIELLSDCRSDELIKRVIKTDDIELFVLWYNRLRFKSKKKLLDCLLLSLEFNCTNITKYIDSIFNDYSVFTDITVKRLFDIACISGNKSITNKILQDPNFQLTTINLTICHSNCLILILNKLGY
jgi:hypothetical protein